MAEGHYAGRELELFQHARSWKRYWSGQLREEVRGDVLEVGAGLGANTPLLLGPAVTRWVCLEPDPDLARQMRVRPPSVHSHVEVREGTLAALDPAECFDTILYVDVLEHIDDDVGELSRAVTHLRPRGRLIVLAPAHKGLMSEFDRAIGHHRRYTRASLRALTPRGTRVIRAFSLDVVGLLASVANRLSLRQSLPTPSQIASWDRVMVPASRLLDWALRYRLGRSVVVVWMKDAAV